VVVTGFICVDPIFICDAEFTFLFAVGVRTTGVVALICNVVGGRVIV